MSKLDNIKTVYSFPVHVEKEVEEIATKEVDGENVEIKKRIKKKVPIQVAIKNPNRQLRDNAELFYNVSVGEGIRAGLMSRKLLQNKYLNDGGLFSNPEYENYVELYVKLAEKKNEYQELCSKEETEKTANQKKTLVREIIGLTRSIQDYENTRNNIFNITAENRALNKLLLWWMLHIGYYFNEEKESWEPIYKGGSFEEKLENYDLLEDEESGDLEKEVFHKAVNNKLAALVAFWYYNSKASHEDFNNLLKEQEEILNKPEGDSNSNFTEIDKKLREDIEKEEKAIEEEQDKK
ncbi:MAG: hypothetical protein HC836_12575 [Richelia sp. RM2_1_2]|nr:hypothetical protein [Richelia sp. RM2_1_2]